MENSNLHDAIKATLLDMGLDPNKKPHALDRFYEIGEMSDEVQEKSVHIAKFDGVTPYHGRILPEPQGEGIHLIPTHDIHLGALNSNVKKFEAYTDYILNTRDTYTIGLGDLIENATKESVGMGIYESEYHIDKQVDNITEMLRPLADSGKLLGLMPGNHEYRTMKLVRMDPMYLVAKELKVPYLGWQGYFQFDVGNQSYTALTFHGAGGSATPAGRLNAVRKLRDIAPFMDMYFMGHVHSKQDDTDVVYYIDPQTGELKSKLRHYIIGGSLLSYFGSYAEMMGLAPAPQGLVRVDLNKEKHRIKIYK